MRASEPPPSPAPGPALQDAAADRAGRSAASRRLRLALWTLLPAALSAAALYVTADRMLARHESRLQLDASLLSGYLRTQEDMLRAVTEQLRQLGEVPPVPLSPAGGASGAGRAAWQFFEGRRSAAALPFSLYCHKPPRCAQALRELARVGGYLSDAYAAHWAASSFRAAPLLLVSTDSGVSLSLPAIESGAGFPSLERQSFLAAADVLYDAAGDEASAGAPLRWISDPRLPSAMIAIAPAALAPPPGGSAAETSEAGHGMYAGTLFDRRRVAVPDMPELPGLRPADHDFWLQRNGGQALIGRGPPPEARPGGPRLLPDGVAWKFTDDAGGWSFYYKTGYGGLLRSHAGTLLGALLLPTLALGTGAACLGWYRRRVLLPAAAARRAAAESAAFCQAMADAVPAAICVLSRPDGKLLFVNALAGQWLDAKPGQMLLDPPDAAALLRQALAATEPAVMQTFRTRCGRMLSVRYTPLRCQGCDAVACAFLDESARLETERALAKARKLAARADVARSTFLATMSHEIRTPLYGLLGSLEVLAATGLNGEQRRHVRRIESAAAILQHLISDILDIAKMESGLLTLDRAPFEPLALLQGCVAAYAEMAEQKGLLIYDCADTSAPAWVLGDEERLRQMLGNLLSNAIKFTDSGHVVARMKAEPLPDGKARLTLQVADSGIGISPQEQARLFEPFYQIDGDSHTLRGTGVGLAICSRLAALMGSEIHVTSEPGLGSSFSFSVVLETVEKPPAPAPDLAGAVIHVRSIRKELSDNLCEWLGLWGAQASCLAPGVWPAAGRDGAVLDVVLAPRAEAPREAGMMIVTASGAAAGAEAVDRHSRHAMGFALQRLLSGAPRPAEPAEPADGACASLSGLRVLAVEDNPINRMTIQDQLEQLGCHVAVAPDGAEALNLWNIQPFDVVLTDLNMPRMNGCELARALRDAGAAVPIIGVTANALRAEESRCREAGMDSWLAKPVKLRTLRRVIRHLATAAAPARAETPAPAISASGSAPAPADDGAARGIAAEQARRMPAHYRALFMETMQNDLEQLEQAVARRDPQAMRTLLHRMRGGLGVVQQTALLRQAIDADERLREAGPAEAAGPLAAFMENMRAMLAQLRGMC